MGIDCTLYFCLNSLERGENMFFLWMWEGALKCHCCSCFSQKLQNDRTSFWQLWFTDGHKRKEDKLYFNVVPRYIICVVGRDSVVKNTCCFFRGLDFCFSASTLRKLTEEFYTQLNHTCQSWENSNSLPWRSTSV